MVTGNEIPQGASSLHIDYLVRKFEACHHFFRLGQGVDWGGVGALEG